MRFEFLNIKFYLSFWAVALLTFSVVSSVDGQDILLLCLISASLHEAGHLILICKSKGKPRGINIYPSEIQIISNSVNLSLKEDILITLAGVFTNFILSAVFYFIFLLYNLRLFYDFSVCNLIMGIFNILPIESLDGGQLLRMLISTRLPPKTVDTIFNILSAIFIIPIAVLGILVLFVSKNNFSLIFIIIYFLVNLVNKEIR